MHRLGSPASSARAGFTLVEILIVVVILGILAAIVIPQFANASDNARQAAFKANLHHLITAGQLYLQKYGELPAQEAGAALPAPLIAELPTTSEFPLRTAIGGYWHVGYFADVKRYGVGIWWPTDETSVYGIVQKVDADIDDGNDATGDFQVRDGSRYYWMLN